MKDAVLYIHGKGGCTAECEHYRPLFPGYEVVGLDYHTFSPWETGTEIHAAVTKLKEEFEGIIQTDFGENLSWDYLSYVRSHPVGWTAPTHILYGSLDNLTSLETISDFAEKNSAMLTVMEGGDHWFHTEEQMCFLDEWIKRHESMSDSVF